jgi:hypothetical protein
MFFYLGTGIREKLVNNNRYSRDSSFSINNNKIIAFLVLFLLLIFSLFYFISLIPIVFLLIFTKLDILNSTIKSNNKYNFTNFSNFSKFSFLFLLSIFSFSRSFSKLFI